MIFKPFLCIGALSDGQTISINQCS